MIRHVYGEDCTILIEQFGLVTTFNRALQKFSEQYASTLVAETTVAEEKRPVTRDAELPSQKPTEDVEPAPVLALTPPEAPAARVANDPRERRRLAKLAAEQAKEAHIASNATPATVESTEAKEEAPAPVVAETEVVAEPAAPEQASSPGGRRSLPPRCTAPRSPIARTGAPPRVPGRSSGEIGRAHV